MDEEWRAIKGYEGLYEVSNLGRVKSLKRKRVPKDYILKPSYCRYLEVGLSKGRPRKQKNFRVHRLVVETFIGDVGSLTVNHIDGNKLNNRLDNLEIISRSENTKHAWETGIHKKINYNSRKLIKEDVEFIKKSSLKRVELAEMFNVSRQTINNVINNKTYIHGF